MTLQDDNIYMSGISRTVSEHDEDSDVEMQVHGERDALEKAYHEHLKK